ncbi:MAG: hypothetical protein QM679_12445 [Patulibacter sp.]
MTYTDEQILAAAARAQALDTPTAAMDDTTDLRRIADTADTIRSADAHLYELVEIARANGRSWGEIGLSLGVSRQAARERFTRRKPSKISRAA